MTALCVQACRQRRRTRFISAASLINELVEAQRNGQLSRALNRWKKWELLAIDEMGYVPLEETGAELLFQVITERAERAAILITTNLLCGEPHNRFNAESSFMLRGARRGWKRGLLSRFDDCRRPQELCIIVAS